MMEWIAIWAIGLFVGWFFWQSWKFWKHTTDVLEAHTRALKRWVNEESESEDSDEYPGAGGG